jgi:hypothetical protein
MAQLPQQPIFGNVNVVPPAAPINAGAITAAYLNDAENFPNVLTPQLQTGEATPAEIRNWKLYIKDLELLRRMKY